MKQEASADQTKQVQYDQILSNQKLNQRVYFKLFDFVVSNNTELQ